VTLSPPLFARYWYPQENINASAIPLGTPLYPTHAGKHSSLATEEGWTNAVEQAPFAASLVVKPTSPVGIHVQAAASVRKISDGHFFFDLGRNVQAGLRLTVALPDALSNSNNSSSGTSVRFRVAEELDSKTGLLFWPPRTGLHPEVRLYCFTHTLDLVHASRGAPVSHAIEACSWCAPFEHNPFLRSLSLCARTLTRTHAHAHA
jgi:hypothetical protein